MKMTTGTIVDTVLALLACSCLAGGGTGMQAQTTRPPAQQAAGEDAVARQQAAIAQMQESIAKQRASVQKQLGQSTDAFFILPPPERMQSVAHDGGTAECAPLPDGEVRSLARQADATAEDGGGAPPPPQAPPGERRNGATLQRSGPGATSPVGAAPPGWPA